MGAWQLLAFCFEGADYQISQIPSAHSRLLGYGFRNIDMRVMEGTMIDFVNLILTVLFPFAIPMVIACFNKVSKDRKVTLDDTLMDQLSRLRSYHGINLSFLNLSAQEQTSFCVLGRKIFIVSAYINLFLQIVYFFWLKKLLYVESFSIKALSANILISFVVWISVARYKDII